jgi:hypothetical protein
MTEPVLLTFAELEFVLRSAAGDRPATVLDPVRRRLAFAPEVSTDIVAGAGVASLLARGLCRQDDSTVVPGDFIVAVAAALASRHTTTEAAGWLGDRPTVVHLFSGTAARLIVTPAAFGLFTVEATPPDRPLSEPLLRFVDLCTEGDGEAAVLVRSSTADDPDDDPAQTGVAVSRDADGRWHLSDTADSPDRGRVVTHEAVVDRFVELFGTAVGV